MPMINLQVAMDNGNKMLLEMNNPYYWIDLFMPLFCCIDFNPFKNKKNISKKDFVKDEKTITLKFSPLHSEA